MNVTAIIMGVVPFEVNGVEYFTIYFANDSEPDNVLEARLPGNSIYPHPHVNDHIRIHYVLGIPTRIDHVDSQ